MLHMVLPELVLNTIICLGGRGYASYGPSRASSECSTPLSHAGIRSEKLEYPCLNFVQVKLKELMAIKSYIYNFKIMFNHFKLKPKKVIYKYGFLKYVKCINFVRNYFVD